MKKMDMSSEAVGARLRMAMELGDLCRQLGKSKKKNASNPLSNPSQNPVSAVRPEPIPES